jgi:hypothetical protein
MVAAAGTVGGAHPTAVSTLKLCAGCAPFDFTASGGYAQGERRKKSSKKAPFVLSVAKSKHRRICPVHYALIWSRHATTTGAEEAEACFHKALDIARKQQAKSFKHVAVDTNNETVSVLARRAEE